jgi:hypothetical protein
MEEGAASGANSATEDGVASGGVRVQEKDQTPVNTASNRHLD